jgi:hypothetical protein
VRWYEFKLGDKTGGELLAAFELLEINPVKKTLYFFFERFYLIFE